MIVTRLLVVSDIHGHYDQFLWLMDLVKYNPRKDRLICLGDLIDRGPKSKEVVEWFMPGHPGENAIVIRGNHEETLLGYIAGYVSYSTYTNNRMGGGKTLDSYQECRESEIEAHVKFLNELPYYHRESHFIFTHAGLDLDKSLEAQDVDDFLYDDKKIYTKGTSRLYKKDIVIFGHVPTDFIRSDLNQPSLPSYIWYDTVYKNKIGIDCGNYSRKRLACLDLTNCVEYYQGMRKKDQEVTTTKETLAKQLLKV